MTKKDTRPRAIVVSTETRTGRALTWLFKKLGRHTQTAPDEYSSEAMFLFFASKATLKAHAREQEVEALNTMIRDAFDDIKGARHTLETARSNNVYAMEDFRKPIDVNEVAEEEGGDPPTLLSELSSGDESRLFAYDKETEMITYTLPQGEQVNTKLAQLLTDYETLQ